MTISSASLTSQYFSRERKKPLCNSVAFWAAVITYRLYPSGRASLNMLGFWLSHGFVVRNPHTRQEYRCLLLLSVLPCLKKVSAAPHLAQMVSVMPIKESCCGGLLTITRAKKRGRHNCNARAVALQLLVEVLVRLGLSFLPFLPFLPFLAFLALVLLSLLLVLRLAHVSRPDRCFSRT